MSIGKNRIIVNDKFKIAEIKKNGLTVVETILVLLCILFFIIGGLLLKYDRPLIEENSIDVFKTTQEKNNKLLNMNTEVKKEKDGK